MDSSEKIVRVFISSTFRDMHAERDHLVTVVFPELRERLERLGLEFYDVDLRWGVPEKDANGETANSWEYCRQWIDRVEPFFVCILGQRYGWVPEPEKLKAEDEQVRQREHPRSITDMEVRHAVLDSQRKRHSYFYLRETKVPESDNPIYSEFVDSTELQEKLESLKEDIRGCDRPARDYTCRWKGDGFDELEDFGNQVLEDLWSGVLRDECYVSKEVWREVLGADPDSDPRYTDASEPLSKEIWEKIVALAKPEPLLPLDAEQQQMEKFAESRLRWFQGRTDELKALTDLVQSPDPEAPRFAVVSAIPGQGKSALLAKLWRSVVPAAENGSSQSLSEPTAYNLQPTAFVIAHFVGATERSADARSLVLRILDELDRTGFEWSEEKPSDDEDKPPEEPKLDYNSLCLKGSRNNK